MKNEHNENIIRFLKDNIEPLDDSIYGLSYRASAYLTDRVYLPCVIFRNPKSTVNLALRRFKEEQKGKEFLVNRPQVTLRLLSTL